MSLGRPVVVVMVALCSLAAPATAPAQQQPAAVQGAADAPGLRRGNETLSKVIIYGSLGAIAGALGSLRVRRGPDTVGDDEAAR
jgi:hypothetical protein